MLIRQLTMLRECRLMEWVSGKSGTMSERGCGSRLTIRRSLLSPPTPELGTVTVERPVTGELGTDLRRNGLRNISTREVVEGCVWWGRELRFIGLTSFSYKHKQHISTVYRKPTISDKVSLL